MDSSRSTGQNLIYAMIGIALICIVGAIYKKQRVNQALLQRARESAERKILLNQALTPSEQQSLNRPDMPVARRSKEREKKLRAVRPQQIFIPPPTYAQKEKSKEVINNFVRESHIAFEAPGNFNFSPMEMEQGFTGFYGEDPLQKAKVTGIATSRMATDDQVLSFLKTDADSIPNLATNPVKSFSGAEALPPPPGNSGFSGGTMWNGKLENGENVTAVYLKRADNNGSYLFVLSGPDAYFKNNDGSFDSIYDSARALTPNGK